MCFIYYFSMENLYFIIYHIYKYVAVCSLISFNGTSFCTHVICEEVFMEDILFLLKNSFLLTFPSPAFSLIYSCCLNALICTWKIRMKSILKLNP